MQVLQGMRGLDTPRTSDLVAEECRRNYCLGKKLFSAFLISNSFTSEQIKDFHIFLIFIVSLEKSIRANFSFTGDLLSLTLLSLTRVEMILADFESPVTGLFKEDLINLKYSLEHYLKE